MVEKTRRWKVVYPSIKDRLYVPDLGVTMNIQATSLQDDIARWATTDSRRVSPSSLLVECILNGLHRNYYLVKLADLPEVEEVGHHLYAVCDTDEPSCSAHSAEYARERAITYLAVALHLESHESEAAVLARRRDELAQQYGVVEYDGLMQWAKDLIDRTLAAEAEVAQLKEARS